LSFVDSQTYDVTVEIVNGTATTTLAGINSSSYAVTSADISNWTGDLNFAAFKGGPGANWWVSRTFVTNVAFYADAPVPEPTSALTFATGLITLGGICIRRRRK
jgi:hypothetical protein